MGSVEHVGLGRSEFVSWIFSLSQDWGERGSERPVPADLKCAVYWPFPAPVGTFWRIWRPVLN